MKKKLIFLIIGISLFSCKTNNLDSFIHTDMEILDSLSGFLTNDNLKDIIVVLKHKNEKDFVNSDKNEPVRPILILLGQSDGSLKLAGKCDSAIMAFYLGGTLGDPFEGVTIDSVDRFTIAHLTGSFERCETKATFNFNAKDKEWILTAQTIRCFVPDDKDSTIFFRNSTSKDFGKVLLSNYSINKEYP